MISRRRFLATSAAAALLPSAARAVGAPMPIFDAHIHFSHDAAERFSAGEAVAILEKAGLKRALVSSSGDAGTRALYAAAPDLVLPSLRPYRRRGEIGSWVDDPSVIDFLGDRLKRFKWVAVGEFHLFAAQTDKAVPRRMIELARQHNLLLHAHSDAGAVDGIFAQWPEARVLWAHAGFVDPDIVGPMLGKHANLWTDLAFRSEHAHGGRVDDDWRSLFAAFPDRVTVGTDTYTPERWHYVAEHADWTRQWLTDLPPDLAEKIAWRNGEAMIRPHLACATALAKLGVLTVGDWRILGRDARLAKRPQALDHRVARQVVKVGYRLPAGRLRGVHWRVDHSVLCRDPTIVGPAHHRVADVDDERAGDVRYVAPATGWASSSTGTEIVFSVSPGAKRSLPLARV